MKNSKTMLKELSQYQTPAISDILDMIGINGGLEQILPLQDGLAAYGPAYTVSFVSAEEADPAVAADYIDDIPEGSVVVIDNQGRVDCTVWGDILSHVAQLNKLNGTVINGCCRDVKEIRKLKYPVFSKSHYMKSGKGRVRLKAVQTQIEIGDTTVSPGDFVCADDSGVIIIPQNCIEEAIIKLHELQEMEQAVIKDVNQGLSLKAARKKNNYNTFALKRGCVS